MTDEPEKKPYYICSCSGGKDSVATIILAHEHNEPLDEIIFCEVMFDENISGELPEHIDFIYNVLKPKCEEWGYKFTIVRGEKNYIDLFHRRKQRALKKENEWKVGLMLGFPLQKGCFIRNYCKIAPIERYLKQISPGGVHQYLGIAYDEVRRLKTMHERNNATSLLEKYKHTEAMASWLCRKHGLLSPYYKYQKRGGCWFCPNARFEEFYRLYKEHNDLFMALLKLEQESEGERECVWFRSLAKETFSNIYRKCLYKDGQGDLFDD